LQQLQRLVANLLDNAIKHVPIQGTVTISIEASEDNLSIIVCDTGCGIAAEDLPKIFDRFYRCERSRSAAGFGLGLSLVRAIARFHGGDVCVASTAEKGSSFVVTLPLLASRSPSSTHVISNMTDW
jgi:signal transduction histidine kinase